MVASRRPAIARSAVATGRGDDGTTGLLFGGRIAKDDPRTEAYGSVDEAVAALGMARAALQLAGHSDLAGVILVRQRELFVVGAELAANPAAAERLADGVTRVSEEMLGRVEADLSRWEAEVEMPREFVVPGETDGSAALELARTVLRRAERRVISLQRAGELESQWLVPYLNRVADLVWVLARAAEQAEHRQPTPVRSAPRTWKGKPSPPAGE
ncbi:MAG TPA: cob(I)yrinic acid a,c-diamide adenosyltransferase [Candidatus Caenarcaniphilales bacterium]|nr:cob(I)yrinic acid a,c-diamide adenosyltransferase [Candidatus Caenarcaniphilales bacterium]